MRANEVYLSSPRVELGGSKDSHLKKNNVQKRGSRFSLELDAAKKYASYQKKL